MSPAKTQGFLRIYNSVLITALTITSSVCVFYFKTLVDKIDSHENSINHLYKEQAIQDQRIIYLEHGREQNSAMIKRIVDKINILTEND